MRQKAMDVNPELSEQFGAAAPDDGCVMLSINCMPVAAVMISQPA
jgi:hypothetical protein